MLVASIHATRKSGCTLCVILAILIAAILFFFGPKERGQRTASDGGGPAGLHGLFRLGDGDGASEVKTIVVPPEDDTLLQRYNEIQLGQGMDLTAQRAGGGPIHLRGQEFG
jgi:hypothetical protein